MIIITALKRLFHPSVEKSLSTFNDKIDELDERIKINDSSIKGAEMVIQESHNFILSKKLESAQAENAIVALELIVGERD